MKKELQNKIVYAIYSENLRNGIVVRIDLFYKDQSRRIIRGKKKCKRLFMYLADLFSREDIVSQNGDVASFKLV